MELIAYLVMAGGAYYVLISRRRTILYAWFIVFLAYSLTIRLMPPAADMVVYTAAVMVWPPPLNLYTLREPVIWIGAPLLHLVLDNSAATFFVIDMVTGVIVIRSMKLIDDKSGRMMYIAPTVMSSFVFLLGQQNVLRQHVAFVILLWALSTRSRHTPTSVVLLFLSVMTHNSMAMMVGYWLDSGQNNRPRYGPYITAIAVIMIPVLWPFLGKSVAATGLDTRYLYISLISGIGCVVLYSCSGRMYREGASALLNYIVFIPAIGVLGAAGFERISMVFLVLVVIDLYRYQEVLRLRRRNVAQFAYGVLVIPVFLFPSALQFLMG